MSVEDKPLKGILKTALHGQSPSSRPDPRAVALQHARILQHRKDLERQILDSVIRLSEFPVQRSPEYSASHPASSDVADFKSHVRLFQPGDYDDLIEERNANYLCGYALCARPRPEPSKGGPWKLINVGKANFDIVDRKESERWCSDECKRRALYVKVQLNETAAWERAGLPDIHVELQDENPSTRVHITATLSSTQATARNTHEATRNTTALALERGDPGGSATLQSSLASLTIRDKEVGAPEDTTSDNQTSHDEEHLTVEGYTPGTSRVMSRDE